MRSTESAPCTPAAYPSSRPPAGCELATHLTDLECTAVKGAWPIGPAWLGRLCCGGAGGRSGRVVAATRSRLICAGWVPHDRVVRRELSLIHISEPTRRTP